MTIYIYILCTYVMTIYMYTYMYMTLEYTLTHTHTRIYIVNTYIIIITSSHQHWYPWPSLASPPYCPLFPAGLQGYIPYRHRAAGRPAFARPCEGLHRSTSLMSSSQLLQQCPACLVRLTLIVFVMGSRWPYSCCFVEYCLHNSFNIAWSILIWLPSSFFSIRLFSVPVVHPYSSIDTTATWKKLRFILSISSDFHITDSQSIAAHAFASRVSMSISVDETLLPR